MSYNNILLIALYFIAVFAIGLWTKKRESSEDYVIAGRKIGFLQSSASMFAVIGGFILVGQAALAFELGFGAMWFWVGAGLGLVLLGFNAKKVKEISDDKKYLTISEYIQEKFGNKNAKISSIVLFVAFFSLLVGQFIAGGSIFAPLLGISYPLAVIILGVGTLLYLLLGGFKAVIKTDFLQAIIMLFIFLSLVLNINLGSEAVVQFDLMSVGFPMAIAFVVVGVFVIFGSADIWQRIYATKNIKSIKKASYLSAIGFVSFGAMVSYVGIVAKSNFPDIASNEAFFYGIFNLLPPQLLGLAVVVVLAAIMSTIDTELFYLSSSLSRDFSKNKKGEDSNELVKDIRKFILILAVIAMVIAIFVSSILQLLFALISLTLIVSPMILFSLFWNLKRKAVFLGMVGGLIAFFVLVFSGNLNSDNMIATLIATVIFFVLGQIFLKKEVLLERS
ncbi:MAG: hypothetical protein V1851_02720 [Patescibacteria group bacterium]